MLNNKIELSGIVVRNFEYSHDCVGEKFYSTSIASKRESGIEDIVNLIIPEKIIETDFIIGDSIFVTGSVRTRNIDVDGKKHLQLYIFVNYIDYYNNCYKDVNIVQLSGYICKRKRIRKTPLGRIISDIILAVNREYQKSDYIPCIVWGKNASFIDELNDKDIYIIKMNITGRFQSREYIKNDKVKTAFEVSVQTLDITTPLGNTD